MEWIATFAIGLALVVLFAPLIMLLGTVFILVPLAHLAPAPTMVARTSFHCPFARRRVSVAFVTPPGTDRPSDVASCSLFTGGRGIRCRKGCLGLARTAWTPSAMTPRYSLVADGVAFRNAA
jgi:hypothetical protein